MFGGSQSHSRQEWSKKWESEIGPANGRDSASGCFDCNICLDFANDPVVTLCGHLYCWPCIYKWLTRDPSTTQQCPVCKAPVSQTTLVPLYGRGGENTGKSVASKATLDIPHRPPPYRPDTLPAEMTPSPRSSHHHHYFHYDRYPPSPSPLHFRTTARHFYPVSGGTAYALLPWVLGWFFRSPETPARARLFDSDSYHLTGEGGGVRARRQELQAERSLSRISVFLLCCLVLCVFLF